MAKNFTKSQQVRLRLWAMWKRDDRGYGDFEEFYSDVMDGIFDNLEVIVKTMDL